MLQSCRIQRAQQASEGLAACECGIDCWNHRFDGMSRSTMRRTVGVLVMEHIAVGLVESHKVLGSVSIYPESVQSLDPLQSMPAEGIVDCIRQQVEKVTNGEKVAEIGIGFPGIIRNGVIEDSPNFQQAKGFAFQAALSSALSGKFAGSH